MGKPEALAGETVHVRRRIGQAAAERSDGVAAHVVGGNEQDIQPLGGSNFAAGRADHASARRQDPHRR
jgi:hypothetical protein